MPITGFCGFVLTSATGAKSRLTPAAASSAPSEAATRSLKPTSSTTPSAAFPGYELPVAASSRVTSPPSSSIATITSSRFGAQVGGQRAELLRALDVPGVEDDAAEPLGEAPRVPSRARSGPSKPGRMQLEASRSSSLTL